MTEWVEQSVAASGGLPLFPSWLRGSVAPCLSAAFPIHDWQFWVATGAFVLALAWLLKGVLPIPFLSKRAKAKKTQKRVSITIEGKAQK